METERALPALPVCAQHPGDAARPLLQASPSARSSVRDGTALRCPSLQRVAGDAGPPFLPPFHCFVHSSFVLPALPTVSLPTTVH